MFCTSLRRRPAFIPVLPMLVSDTRLQLRESILTTHDLTIPLNGHDQITNPRNGSSRNLRVLLLSRFDVMNDQACHYTIQRIQHFSALTGGKDIAIMFLLSSAPLGRTFEPPATNDPPITNFDEQEGVFAVTKLTTMVLEFDGLASIPVLIIPKLEQLPNMLHNYTQNLIRVRSQQPPSTLTTTAFDLLQLCTSNPPMPRQTAYVLSDVFPNLRSLAEACTSASPETDSDSPSQGPAAAGGSLLIGYGNGVIKMGKAELTRASKIKYAHDLIGGEEYSFLVDFWMKEWTVE